MKTRTVKMTALLLLLSCTLFAACAGPAVPQKSQGEHEAEENRGAWAAYPMGCFLDGVLYFYPESRGGSPQIVLQTGEDVIMAAELDSGEAFPLCGKPDCAHGTGGCNAVLEGIEMKLFTVYDQKLYWIAWMEREHYLYCANLDGSEHRRVMALDHELELQMGSGLVCIYDDKLIRFGSDTSVRDGKPTDTVTLYEQPIRENSEPRIVYRLEQPSNVMMKLAGGTLFCAVWDVSGEENAQHLTLLSYKPRTGELETLFDGSAPSGAGDMLVSKDGKKLIFSGGSAFFEFSLEDKSFTSLYRSESEEPYWVMDGVLFSVISNTEFRCTDYAGNTLFEGKLNSPSGFSGSQLLKRYIGFYGTKFYLSCTSARDGGWYVVSVDPYAQSTELVCSGNGNTVNAR